MGNREELAWAAGFFDGEGSVGAYSYDRFRPRLYLCIGQADDVNGLPAAVLIRFQEAIGGLGRLAVRPTSTGRLGRRPQHVLRASNFEHVQAIIAMLWRWLGPVKRQQYVKALARHMEGT